MMQGQSKHGKESVGGEIKQLLQNSSVLQHWNKGIPKDWKFGGAVWRLAATDGTQSSEGRKSEAGGGGLLVLEENKAEKT